MPRARSTNSASSSPVISMRRRCRARARGRCIGREQRARAAVERDARPPGARAAARSARASARSRARRMRPARSRPASPWLRAGPENGIGERRDQLADPRRRRGLAAPVDRHEQRARAAGRRSARTLKMPSPCAVATRAKPPSASRSAAASSGWISTNGSGDVLAEPRAHAGARHGVPLVAHAAGVEHEREVRSTARCAAPGLRARRSAPCGRA